MSPRRQPAADNRRMIRFFVLVALLCAPAWTAAAPAARAKAGEGILNIHATFSGDPRHEVTVSWRTERPLPDPAVRYGPVGAGEDAWTVVGEAETVESAGGFNHHVALAGLRPATRYRYRVSGPGSAWGPPCSFRTAPQAEQPFTFAVVGDVQGRAEPSATWQTLGRWVAGQDVAFLLLLGDLVQEGSEQPQWDAFFNCATPDSDRSLFHSTVVMPVLGNHDHYRVDSDGKRTAGIPRLYLDQFRLPPNEDEALDGRAYTFACGQARFVILDTSGHGPDGPTHPQQTRWLASLDLEDRPWVMAAHHVPVLRFLNHVPSPAARNVWRPHFYRRYVDIVFNGHNHSHAVSWPILAADLDGRDGGRGFAGPWRARFDVGAESGMDALFLLEENDLVRYPGYEAAGRSLRSLALGTHGEAQIDAVRSLQAIDTARTRELWMGYVYEKRGKWYGGGGWQLSDSTRPEQAIRVGATRVMDENGRYGHFQVALGESTAIAPEPIAEEGTVPEEPYFVLAKFLFEEGRAVARLKTYEAPEPLPLREPEDWDATLEAEGDWALKLDTLTHRGARANRLALVDEFRLGERMADVLLVPEARPPERSPLVEERFDGVPTIDRERGVVYVDTGGVNSSGPARDAWFVRYRENSPRMPLIVMVTVGHDSLRARTVFYDDYDSEDGGQYRTGDVFDEFELTRPAAGAARN